VRAIRGLVPVALLVAGLAAGLAAGCNGEKEPAFEPSSDATHVTGTLVNKDDQRPVDGPMWLIVRLAGTAEERVMIPSLFTAEPPSTEKLALQQKADELKIGDRFTATGTRNAEGALVAERIEILGP
jgi:hypothetical protein